MAMTIWKYTLAAAERQDVAMPKGALLLAVHEQNDALCLWALVDSSAPLCGRAVWIVGTGHPANNVTGLPHVGTAVMFDGALVWHVFDGGEVRP